MSSSDLFLRLREQENGYARLDCLLPGARFYEERTVALAQIADLLKVAERDFYTIVPDLRGIGQRLFQWLDGAEGWLRRALDQSNAPLLVLHLEVGPGLRHLPWEALHDGVQFLVQRLRPVVPVRSFPAEVSSYVLPQRELNMVFMASSPEGVAPPLDFEEEESAILKATQGLPVRLRVEESGNIPLLGKRLERYGAGAVDILHLTGHASVDASGPFFIAEGETGERQDVRLTDLVGSLGLRIPPVVFLSGCRTGQAGAAGAVPSLAEAVLEATQARAVLGWGLPIGDDVATLAAVQLYRSLSTGLGLGDALAKTYKVLLKDNKPGWHLLRLYVKGECLGALVPPPGDVAYQAPKEAVYDFLDAAQQVRVATAEQFVGRRRLLQRGLKVLQDYRQLGVILEGLGGNGKSSLAARLVRRLVGYDWVVLYRDLDALRLTKLLADQCESKKGHEILNGQLPLMQKWRSFLKEGLNTTEQRLVFVLDDFEANLELRDGQYVLKAGVINVLDALLGAIAGSNLPHRLIITSRYDFSLTQSLNHRLERFEVPAMKGADLRKKCERLISFTTREIENDKKKNYKPVDPEMRKLALFLADGNPRLLERLDRVLQAPNLDQQVILAALQRTEKEYREEILVKMLLEQQASALRTMLGQGRIFELPVPEAVFSLVCLEIPELATHLERARALGLLEVEVDGSLRVPHLVIPTPSEPLQPLAQRAIEGLYPLWWGPGNSEIRVLELLRLGRLAQDWEKVVLLSSAVGRGYQDQGRYWDAEPYFREALELNQQHLDPEHPSVAATLNNLAELYRLQGRLTEMEPLMQRALAIREKVLGPDDPDVAQSRNNLAGLYDNQGKYSEAEPLYLRALAIREKVLDPDHADVAGSLNNLANLYYSQGKYSEAESLYERALAIREKVLGPEHPDVALSLNNLAILYRSQEKYSEAEPLYLRALAIQEKVLGPEHPDVATTLNNLATLYHSQGKYSEAEPLSLRALAIREKVLGPEHLLVATTFNNLATLYHSQGKYNEAEPLYERALTIREKVLGPEHPDVAQSLNNLAGLYYDQGKYSEAEPLFLGAIVILLRSVGINHPNTQTCLRNFHAMLQGQGRCASVEELVGYVEERLRG